MGYSQAHELSWSQLLGTVPKYGKRGQWQQTLFQALLPVFANMSWVQEDKT